MTAPTSPWNLPLYASTDTIPSLEGVLNAQSNALNTALNTIQLTSYTEYATRSLMNAVAGTVIGQHATVNADSTAANNTDYYWNGSTWLPLQASGLVPLIPTSVAGTGVSVGPSGVVTYTASPAVSVNGVFTTAYTQFLAIWDKSAASVANGGSVRFRAAGTDDASANYDLQQWWTTGATATAQATTAQVFASTNPVGGAEDYAEWTINAPAQARPTKLSVVSDAWSSSTVGIHSMSSSRLNTTTSYDGLTFTASTGTITGTIRFYGYLN